MYIPAGSLSNAGDRPFTSGERIQLRRIAPAGEMSVRFIRCSNILKGVLSNCPPPQTTRKTIFNRSLFFHASRWNILLRRAFWTQMQIRFSVCLFLTFTFDLSTPVVYPKSIAASSISLSAFDCKIEQTKWLASVYRGVCSTTLHTCLRDASNSCWEMRNGSARASCSKCSYYSNLLDAANSPLSLF